MSDFLIMYVHFPVWTDGVLFGNNRFKIKPPCKLQSKEQRQEHANTICRI